MSPARPFPKHRRDPEARPAEILAAAIDVFAERGFAAARLEDVARRAGCSKAAIYLYYRDKAALFEAVVTGSAAANLDSLAGEIGHAALAPDEKLALMLRRIGQWLTDSPMPKIGKIVISESGTFPELARLWHDSVIQRGLPVVRAVIEAGVASGRFRPVNADHAARSILGPVLMTAVWRAVFEPVGAARVDVAGFMEDHAAFVLAALRRESPHG